jgi:monoamine oxidase
VDGAGLANLALAGDWTATGLPATIEGSIRSGETAAGFLLRHV